MSKTLQEVAQELRSNNKKTQLIYAFNGTGKTRLSKLFKNLVAPKDFFSGEDAPPARNKILYYNAFTEDLFYWDNDLTQDIDLKLKIQPNAFTQWILSEQGKGNEIIGNFQRYTNEKLNPKFNDYFDEVTFSFARGNDEVEENIKISKGEESNFIWCIFYSLLEQVVDELNTPEPKDRSSNQFDDLEYIFIDDPVSSLDENHLIELAVDIATLIKSSQSSLKFIITTHNPLFYNVLHNQFKRNNIDGGYYVLEKLDDKGDYNLLNQNDSPFTYQFYLKNQLEELYKEKIKLIDVFKDVELKELFRNFDDEIYEMANLNLNDKAKVSDLHRLTSPESLINGDIVVKSKYFIEKISDKISDIIVIQHSHSDEKYKQKIPLDNLFFDSNMVINDLIHDHIIIPKKFGDVQKIKLSEFFKCDLGNIFKKEFFIDGDKYDIRIDHKKFKELSIGFKIENIVGDLIKYLKDISNMEDFNYVLQKLKSKKDISYFILINENNLKENISLSNVFIDSSKERVQIFRNKSIESCEIMRYHFNFMRNILEKTSTFLGYKDFVDILPKDTDREITREILNRKVNFYSHSKHSFEEPIQVSYRDKLHLRYLIDHLNSNLNFKPKFTNVQEI